MRRWFFVFREGFGLYTRPGVSGLLNILAFAVLAGIGSSLWTAERTIENVRSRLLSMFEIEAYLKPGQEESADSLAAWIGEREGVKTVTVISSEEAARRFAGQYGEELFNLLGENPLPASVRISYDPELVSRVTLGREAGEIGKRSEVDEVVFESELLERTESVASVVRNRLYLAAAIIAAVALALTFQAVRVAGRVVMPWVRAVVLVGGSSMQLRLPFVISGSLAGLTGGLAGVAIASTVQMVLAEEGGIVPMPEVVPAMIIVIVIMLLGTFAAALAVPRGLEHNPVA